MAEENPELLNAKFTGTGPNLGGHMVVTQYWNKEQTSKFEKSPALTACFFGKFDQYESFNQWQKPICNHGCDYNDKPNALFSAMKASDFSKLWELIDQFKGTDWIDLAEVCYPMSGLGEQE